MRLAASEHEIQAAVLDWVNTLPETRAWRVNVGAREYRKSNGKRGIVYFGQPGMADLSGLCHGIRLECEVKRLGEKPTPLQVQWLDFIRTYGGIAFWTDSLDSCQAQLREEYGRRGWRWEPRWQV